MTLANLLSGLVGAIIGGLLSIATAVITIRQQRAMSLAAADEEQRRQRLVRSHTAGVEILAGLITVKFGLPGLATRDEASAEAQAASHAMDRIFVVHTALIVDAELRRRIEDLVPILEQWRSRDTYLASGDVHDARYGEIMNYFEYLNQSIRAHLDGRELPPAQEAPDLLQVAPSSN